MTFLTTHRFTGSHRKSKAGEYVPSTRQADRSAQRIAMQALREQDRRQTGW